MNTPVELPEVLQDKVLNAPESSYGIVTVTVFLKDGRRFRDVKIAWGHQIIRCQGETAIPFSADEIKNIEVNLPPLEGKPGKLEPA